MEKVVDFLQKNPVQYLATVGRDGKAKCRPFMFCLFFSLVTAMIAAAAVTATGMALLAMLMVMVAAVYVRVKL